MKLYLTVLWINLLFLESKKRRGVVFSGGVTTQNCPRMDNESDELSNLRSQALHWTGARGLTIGPGSLARIAAQRWPPSACARTSFAAATLGLSSGSGCRQPSACLPSIFLDRPLDRHEKRSLSYQTGICPGPIFGRNCTLRSRNNDHISEILKEKKICLKAESVKGWIYKLKLGLHHNELMEPFFWSYASWANRRDFKENCSVRVIFQNYSTWNYYLRPKLGCGL